jgi:hypothetical protein
VKVTREEPGFLSVRHRGNLDRGAQGMGIASLRQQKLRVAYGVTFAVMAGLVPAIGRGTQPLRMSGTSPRLSGKVFAVQSTRH